LKVGVLKVVRKNKLWRFLAFFIFATCNQKSPNHDLDLKNLWCCNSVNMTKKTPRNTVYISKRILVSCTTKAIKEAAENAIKVAGYLIRVEKGWLVKEHFDGYIERIELLDIKTHGPISLD